MINDIDKLLDTKVERMEKLAILENMTTDRIKAIIGKNELPSQLQYVVTDVIMARYAKLGSEGMKATSQDGLSFTFSDDDLAPYMDEILAFKEVEDTVTNERHGAVGFF